MKYILTACFTFFLSQVSSAAPVMNADTYFCNDADGFIIGYLYIDVTGGANLEFAGDWTDRDTVNLSSISNLGSGCYRVTIQGMDGQDVINQPGAKCCSSNS